MDGYISPEEASWHVSHDHVVKPAKGDVASLIETVEEDSRDDGEDTLSRSIASEDVGGGENTNSHFIGNSALRTKRTPPKRHHHHRSPHQMPQWSKVHFELLQGEQERKMDRLAQLEEEVNRLRKEKAFEQSKLLMKRGNWLVQLEGLKDDRAFLLKKKQRLEDFLLELQKRHSKATSM
eukprot:Nitzschia sp. Nitz4//scaffold124_size66437//15482//16018//NITZ4_006104-RA/size66437-processed-gene-0.37-mRNA-1//1//CDS//3329534531//4042//frame0